MRRLLAIASLLATIAAATPASAATIYYLVRVSKGKVVGTLGAYDSLGSCRTALASQPNKTGLECRAENTPPRMVTLPTPTPTPRPAPAPTPRIVFVTPAPRLTWTLVYAWKEVVQPRLGGPTYIPYIAYHRDYVAGPFSTYLACEAARSSLLRRYPRDSLHCDSHWGN